MTAVAGFHPFLVASWGSDVMMDADRDRMWAWITRYTLNRSDMMLCDCHAVRVKVQKLVSYPEGRIVEFPWGVDLGRFTPGADSLGLRSRLGWDNAFVILATRSWDPIHGILVLLEAFRIAHCQDSSLRLMLLGDGPPLRKAQTFIANHGLIDAVYRPGMVNHEQIVHFYRAADLYSSCAYSDGTSVSLLEALATGLPVLVADGPGNREWIVPGRNGWLAPAGDAESFAQFMLHAAQMKPNECQRICHANRKTAEERANWDENFELLLRAYDRIEAEYVG
jgi:glycosyltransferase involved in cell wall biosynthesis